MRAFGPVPDNLLVADVQAEEWRFGLNRREIRCLAVNWKRDIAITGDRKGMIRAWNLADGKLLRAIQAYTDAVQHRIGPFALAVAEDGDRVYSCGLDLGEAAAVKVWSLQSGKQVQTLARVGPKPEKSAEVSRKDEPTPEDLEREARQMQRTYKQFILLEAGKRAWLAGNTGYLALWDLASDKAIWKRDNIDIELLDTTPDSRLSLSKTIHGYSLVFRGGRGEVLETLHPSRPAPGAAHFPESLSLLPPDGKRVLTGGRQGDLALWELGNDKPLAVWGRGEYWEVRSIAISADGSHALIGKKNRILQLWNLKSGKVALVLKVDAK